MISLVSATDEHFHALHDLEIRDMLLSFTREQRKHAYAIEVDRKVAALGVINAARPGVGMAWLLKINADSIPESQALRVVRAFKKSIKRIAEAEGLFRIQATTVLGMEREARFMDILGFKPEGVLRQYGPDRADHVMWSIVYA